MIPPIRQSWQRGWRRARCAPCIRAKQHWKKFLLKLPGLAWRKHIPEPARQAWWRSLQMRFQAPVAVLRDKEEDHAPKNHSRYCAQRRAGFAFKQANPVYASDPDLSGNLFPGDWHAARRPDDRYSGVQPGLHARASRRGAGLDQFVF